MKDSESAPDIGPEARQGYRRIVLKVTGESFSGVGDKGVSQEHLSALSEKLIHAARTGLQIAVVVGGGNILRGIHLSKNKSIRPFAAHQMGMIATTINGIALAETLKSSGQKAKLMSAFNIGSIVEPFNVDAGRDHLDAGDILILAGGTGNPYVTTDTCAAIRAAELGADAIFKATKVDGVYSEDPVKNPNAERYDTLHYDQAIDERLGIFDLTAIRICQETKTPIVVFHFKNLDQLDKIINRTLPSSIIKE